MIEPLSLWPETLKYWLLSKPLLLWVTLICYDWPQDEINRDAVAPGLWGSKSCPAQHNSEVLQRIWLRCWMLIFSTKELQTLASAVMYLNSVFQYVTEWDWPCYPPTGNTQRLVFRRYLVWISAWSPAMLNEIFQGFPHTLHEDARTVHQLDQCFPTSGPRVVQKGSVG
jgi:hypothetical protein